MAQPTQSDPQFKLRLPAELKARIDAAARENNRSTNAEMVSTLERAFPDPDSDQGQRKLKTRYLIAELEKLLRDLERL